MLQQRAQAAGRHHHDHACERQHRAGQRTEGQALAKADDRGGQRHQRHQRQDDAHIGGAGQRRGVIGQALIHRHAEHAEDKDLAQVGTDLRPVGDHRFEHERREQQRSEQPAVKADFSREDRAHGQFVDHGVAGPDKDSQQRIRVLH